MHKNGKNDAAYPWDQFVAGRSIEIERKKILPLKIKNALFLQKRIFFLRLIYMCDLAAFLFASA